MSLYNMINGVNPVAFFVLPMLGKHPEEFPRFRDCFLSDPEHPEYDDKIHVYTRVGGGNRESYESEISEMRSMPGFITHFDDSFDCTYASYVFDVPDEWKDDFEKFKQGKIKEFSEKYKERLYATFPKLKEKFDELFLVK